MTLNRSGRIKLSYTDSNREPHRRLLKKLSGLMGHLGCHPHLLPHSIVRDKRIPIEGVAHQCGTVRFGEDPATSALNVDCRAHDLDNLYVVDTSFFPSAGAVNPALTAMANALRVGDHLIERMGARIENPEPPGGGVMSAATIGKSAARGLVAGLVGHRRDDRLVDDRAETAGRDPPRLRRRTPRPRCSASSRSRATGRRNTFSNVVHWGYGTSWGAVRGVMRALGMSPVAATGAHFSAVWGSEQVMLPALEVAPPVTMWGKEEIAIDGFHHLVYVTATGISYELLNGR